MRPLSPDSFSAALSLVWSKEATMATALAAEFLSSERRELRGIFMHEFRTGDYVKARPIESCERSFIRFLIRLGSVRHRMLE